MTFLPTGSSRSARRLLCALALIVLAFPARAEGTLPLSESLVLQAAIEASPDYQDAYRQAAFDKADADQAGRFDNPTIELNAIRTSAPGGDNTGYDIEIEQPLKFSHLMGARASLAHTLFEQAELRQQQGMLQAYWSIKTLYAQAWQAQEQAHLYADFQKKAQDASSRIGKSVKAGQSPVSEGSLFAGDVAKFGSDLDKVKAQESQLRLQLEKASGLNLAEKELGKPSLPAFDNDIAYLEGQARQKASLVRLLEADLKAAQRQKSAAMADSFAPEIAPRFIYGRNPDADEDSVGLGVVITIPLWDQNQAERRKAEASRLYAQRQLDTLQTLPLSERLLRIVDTIDRLDKRIVTLDTDALPNYRKGFSQAQKSFNAGQTDSAALWQIRERLFDTERESLGTLLDSLEARRILSLETGILPQEVTP